MASFYSRVLQANPTGAYELLWLFVHIFCCLITSNVLFSTVFIFHLFTRIDSGMNIKWEVMGLNRAVDVLRFIINISSISHKKETFSPIQ